MQVAPREAVVAAGGELAVEVLVLVDDAATFRDVLHVLVADGADVSISLEAMGACSCMECMQQHDLLLSIASSCCPHRQSPAHMVACACMQAWAARLCARHWLAHSWTLGRST